MDKLQWFKFAPSDWMMGKIMRCDETTQARYMRLVCLYWNKECNLSYEDAEIEIDNEHLDILIKKKIVKLNDDFIKIEFLDEQMDDISKTSVKRRESVNKRWAKVREKSIQTDTSVLQTDTNVIQSDTEESREDKIREDKKINTTAENINFSDLLGFINSTLGKSYKVINSTVKQKYNARLKDGYVKKDFMTAIVNASKDKYHKETNYKYLTVEYFARIKTLDLHCEEIKVKTKKGIHI